MALFWAIAFGGLGLRFAHLGSIGGASTPAPPGDYVPTYHIYFF
jgi:hypothetical protein